MRFYDKNSWKKKIDPAFDDLIKVYLDYIKRTHICSIDKRKRYLSLDDESLKVLERRGYPPLLRELKPNPRNLKKLMNYTIGVGASPDSMLILECFKNIDKLLNKKKKKKSKGVSKNKYSDALESNIMSMINGLPREDSRNYYKKRLLVDLSPKKTKAFFEGKTQKELIKDLVDIGIDVTCLMFQTGFTGYLDLPNGNCNGKKFIKSNVVNLAMQQTYNSISIMTYKKSLSELLEEAQKNDESLYNAIHLDKTLFDKGWVRKRIKRAFYSGDSIFFKELARAIKKPPIDAKLMYGELVIILSSLWLLGLYRLDNSELMELLKTNGVPIQEDIDTFRKYIDRLKDDNILFDPDKLITIKKSRT